MEKGKKIRSTYCEFEIVHILKLIVSPIENDERRKGISTTIVAAIAAAEAKSLICIVAQIKIDTNIYKVTTASIKTLNRHLLVA